MSEVKEYNGEFIEYVQYVDGDIMMTFMLH